MKEETAVTQGDPARGAPACGNVPPDEVAADGGSADCQTRDPMTVPPTAVPARRTRTFSTATMPAALSTAHVTSVWAELVVLAGSVRFVDETPREIVATSGCRVVIVPGIHHHVEPADNTEFYIRFYKRSPTSRTGNLPAPEASER